MPESTLQVGPNKLANELANHPIPPENRATSHRPADDDAASPTVCALTPLAAVLSARALAAGSTLELATYRGVLTVPYLDAPEAETGALLRGAAVHDLGWLRRIVVRGEDRFRWLSGMVTNAVETLPAGHGAYSLVLNAQGRIQGDLTVWRSPSGSAEANPGAGAEASGDELQIEVTAEQEAALLAHFDRFIIMDDVELMPLAELSAVGLTGPEAGRILSALGLGETQQPLTVGAIGQVGAIPVRVECGYGTIVPHYALWTGAGRVAELWDALLAAGALPAGANAVETLRIVEGIPAYGIDIQSRDLVQETAQMRAVSFTKGCYLGQEIVERIRSRGQVHRRLWALELTPEEEGSTASADAAVAGAEVTIGDGKPAGVLSSVARLHLDGARRIFAIGMLRAEAEARREPIRYAGGRVQLLNTPPKLDGGASAAEEKA